MCVERLPQTCAFEGMQEITLAGEQRVKEFICSGFPSIQELVSLGKGKCGFNSTIQNCGIVNVLAQHTGINRRIS